MIQILTATGMRPEAWELCKRWMRAQAYRGEVRWIIVDDGAQPQSLYGTPDGWTTCVVRAEPFWQPGDNTQARNLLEGLGAVDVAHPLVIVEDDDYYAPDWLDTVAEHLRFSELVGEQMARYYNVAQRRGQQLHNKAHASLCATAMRGGAILTFQRVCQQSPKFIDIELWHHHRGEKHLFPGHRVVGIKGLPGREGIGMGHRKGFKGEYDPDGALLRQWVGDDARYYDTVAL